MTCCYLFLVTENNVSKLKAFLAILNVILDYLEIIVH